MEAAVSVILHKQLREHSSVTWSHWNTLVHLNSSGVKLQSHTAALFKPRDPQWGVSKDTKHVRLSLRSDWNHIMWWWFWIQQDVDLTEDFYSTKRQRNKWDWIKIHNRSKTLFGRLPLLLSWCFGTVCPHGTDLLSLPDFMFVLFVSFSCWLSALGSPLFINVMQIFAVLLISSKFKSK